VDEGQGLISFRTPGKDTPVSNRKSAENSKACHVIRIVRMKQFKRNMIITCLICLFQDSRYY